MKNKYKRVRKFVVANSKKETFAILRILCGPMRFKIILVLGKYRNGLIVSRLADILGSSLSRVSHQLRILKKYNLVEAKKINRETLYRLANHRIRKFLKILFF